jgi:hypothetical protein
MRFRTVPRYFAALILMSFPYCYINTSLTLITIKLLFAKFRNFKLAQIKAYVENRDFLLHSFCETNHNRALAHRHRLKENAIFSQRTFYGL